MNRKGYYKDRTLERRNSVVHRWLREDRERSEGIRSAPGKAEAEIGGIQCEIAKVLEATAPR